MARKPQWKTSAKELADATKQFDEPFKSTYRDEPNSPLFPFGFGLSYTQFHLGAPRLEKTSISRDESTAVHVDVTNRGDRAGDETVQLYIRDLVSSVTRPIKELKGFQRITLQPGDTTTVSLPISPEHLAFWNINMDFMVEPGEFLIMVGPNSRDLQTVTLSVI